MPQSACIRARQVAETESLIRGLGPGPWPSRSLLETARLENLVTKRFDALALALALALAFAIRSVAVLINLLVVSTHSERGYAEFCFSRPLNRAEGIPSSAAHRSLIVASRPPHPTPKQQNAAQETQSHRRAGSRYRCRVCSLSGPRLQKGQNW